MDAKHKKDLEMLVGGQSVSSVMAMVLELGLLVTLGVLVANIGVWWYFTRK